MFTAVLFWGVMTGTILITGASGFIGSAIVEAALERGFEVYAGVRSGSSRRYLQQQGIRFLELDFAAPDKLHAQLNAHRQTSGVFDYIVHCAGVTKTADENEFNRVNYEQTKCVVNTLTALDMVPKRFIFISSLSVLGAIHEDTQAFLCEDDTPCPATAYGVSKLEAERYLQSLSGFPYVIFRPTGVYGPREVDYFTLIRSIRRGISVSIGFQPQYLSFVYVKDLADAIFLAIGKSSYRRTYHISDGKVYSASTFSQFVRKELRVPFLFYAKIPLFVLKNISLLAELVGKRSGKAPLLNGDKYKILKQRNWRCDISLAIDELGFSPKYSLEGGVKETIAWYKKEGWL